MKKKTQALLLFIVVVSQLCLGAYAQGEDAIYTNALEQLKNYNIMCGDQYGNMHPDNLITRAEFSKLAVITSDITAGNDYSCIFGDVKNGYWANGYINASAKNKLIMGYTDGYFYPDKNITYAEGITIVLRILGYGTNVLGNNYPTAYMNKALELGITEDLYFDADDSLDRKTSALILSRALMCDMYSTKPKSQKLISLLDFNVSEECIATGSFETQNDEFATSIGTYKTTMSNKDNYTGKKIKIVTDADNYCVNAFVTDDNVKTITIENANGNTIDYFENGTLKSMNLTDSAVIYFQNKKTTFSQLDMNSLTGSEMVIGYDSHGNFSYGVLNEINLSGPYVVYSDVYTALNEIDVQNAVFFRNNILSSVSQIGKYDVLYVDKSKNKVYAYSDKVTGRYDSQTTQKGNVISITADGNEYALETRNAASKFEGNGIFQTGDYVTLLLGKDGKAADVVSIYDIGKTGGVKTVTGNDVSLYCNHTIENINIKNTQTIYYNGSKSTFENLKDIITDEYKLTIFYKENSDYNYSVLEKCDLYGPCLMENDITKYFNIDTSTVGVVRDGKISSLSELAKNDVVYYNEDLNTLYAYCQKITGVFEEAYPNQANVTSVKISGKEYKLETQQAASDFRDNLKINDYVTILLGKNDEGAFVLTDTAAQVNESYGVLLSCETRVEDKTKKYYAVFMSATGAEQSFEVSKDYSSKRGCVANYTFSDGILTPHFLDKVSLTGSVDTESKKIGNIPLSHSCKIIDVLYSPDISDDHPGRAKAIEISAISKYSFLKEDVIYYKIDDNGKLAFIFLNNVSMDGYKYGLVTQMTKMSSSATYTLDINGEEKKYSVNYVSSVKEWEPVLASIEENDLIKLSLLKSVVVNGKIASLTKNRITIGSGSYKIADDASFYKRCDDFTYEIISYDDLDTDKISSVSLYSDSSVANGGQIRIIKVVLK